MSKNLIAFGVSSLVVVIGLGICTNMKPSETMQKNLNVLSQLENKEVSADLIYNCKIYSIEYCGKYVEVKARICKELTSEVIDDSEITFYTNSRSLTTNTFIKAHCKKTPDGSLVSNDIRLSKSE